MASIARDQRSNAAKTVRFSLPEQRRNDNAGVGAGFGAVWSGNAGSVPSSRTLGTRERADELRLQVPDQRAITLTGLHSKRHSVERSCLDTPRRSSRRLIRRRPRVAPRSRSAVSWFPAKSDAFFIDLQRPNVITHLRRCTAITRSIGTPLHWESRGHDRHPYQPTSSSAISQPSSGKRPSILSCSCGKETR